jgi:lipid-A-disaccharide synthase-like uncharacterized protein
MQIGDYWLPALGFAAQMLFFARTLIQWMVSEKAGKVISPGIYWQLSLWGSILMQAYGYFREDLVIVFGQLLVYGVYLRNLGFMGKWKNLPLLLKGMLVSLPGILAISLFLTNSFSPETLWNNGDSNFFWTTWGMSGQLIFSMRFIYQWLYSERKKESVLPKGFWLLSTAGALLIMVYGLHRHDIVLILSNALGLTIYLRNLVLLRKEKR